jgi:hypothetical protein
MTLSVDSKGYLKIVLHSARYPASDVIGVLVGSSLGTSVVSDAFPLFHTWTLAPMLKLGLTLVNALRSF